MVKLKASIRIFQIEAFSLLLLSIIIAFPASTSARIHCF